MRKLFITGTLFALALGSYGYGQVSNPSIIIVASDPTGTACSTQLPNEQYSGTVYTCQAGRWSPLPTSATGHLLPHVSINWTPGSISANSCTTNTGVLSGAEIGDAIIPSWPVLVSGVFGTMYVNTTNTVTVILCNVTASPVTVPTGFFAAYLFKAGGEAQ